MCAFATGFVCVCNAWVVSTVVTKVRMWNTLEYTLFGSCGFMSSLLRHFEYNAWSRDLILETEREREGRSSECCSYGYSC